MHDQHLYKIPAIEVYGHCRLLLPWQRVPYFWFCCNPGLKNCWHGWPGIELTNSDFSSQSGAYDLSATATPLRNCCKVHISFGIISSSTNLLSIYQLIKTKLIKKTLKLSVCKNCLIGLTFFHQTHFPIQLGTKAFTAHC